MKHLTLLAVFALACLNAQCQKVEVHKNDGMTLSEHETITSIAQAHNKSAYQIILRWHLQCGTIAIPGSSNAAHIAEDYDIFDFELTPDEMQRINALECNHRFASY